MYISREHLSLFVVGRLQKYSMSMTNCATRKEVECMNGRGISSESRSTTTRTKGRKRTFELMPFIENKMVHGELSSLRRMRRNDAHHVVVRLAICTTLQVFPL